MKDGLVFDHYPMRDTEPPAGWVRCGVGCVAESIASGFPSGAHNSEGRGVPHIRPMNIDREGRFDLSSVKSVDGDIPKLLAKGDVLFNNTNSPELIGKTTVIPIDDRLAYSNHMTRIRLEQGMNPSFVAKQLHFLWMSGYFRHRCKNHVNQASIAAEPLSRTVPLLVAPSAQQDRIADELDELLSDLDAGVAALERVRAKLKQYRAAVLKAAVSGELTADWREKHPAKEPAAELLQRILAERRRRWEESQLQKFKDAGKAPPKDWKAKYPQPVAPNTTNLPTLPADWCWVTLDQLSSFITSGSRGWAEYYSDDGPIFVRSQDIRTDVLNLTEVAHVNPPQSTEGARTRLHRGDLLITVTGANVTKTALVDCELDEAYVSQHVGMTRFVDDRVGLFAHTFARAPSGGRRELLKLAYGAGKPGLNLDHLRNLSIPFPPLDEQEAIAEEVQDQLSIIEHLESDLDAKLKSTTALRQSILRHAFTGQLVPQTFGDESASELLKRIAAEREERDRQNQAEKNGKPKSKTPRKRAVKARK